jgi:hypothetical protein
MLCCDAFRHHSDSSRRQPPDRGEAARAVARTWMSIHVDLLGDDD